MVLILDTGDDTIFMRHKTVLMTDSMVTTADLDGLIPWVSAKSTFVKLVKSGNIGGNINYQVTL